MATETSTTIDLDDPPDLEDSAIPQPRGRHRLPDPPARPWPSRPRLLAVIALAVAVMAAGLSMLIPSDSAGRREGPATPRQSAAPSGNPGGQAGRLTGVVPTPGPRTLAAGPVTADFDGFFSWALLDQQGHISGSANLAETSWVGSVLKVWIVSDYLRRSAEQERTPDATELSQASRAIRDSDDDAAEALYRASGGAAQLQRMISICELTDTRIEGSRWRGIRMSARDTVRLGRCVTDGRAAGPSWTTWVRTEMAQVRGSVADADQPFGGRWGIIDGLPADLVAADVGIKNGWIVGPGGNWQVNCLAVADGWSLAVLLRYPADRGLRHGAETCAKVASQLVSPPAA